MKEGESVISAVTLTSYQVETVGAVIAGIVAIAAPIKREGESNE
jgi:hypothetical protein